MKAFVVLLLVVLAAASAYAYGSVTVTSTVTSTAAQVAGGTSEPAALLLSGSLLLGLAGAVKRFTLRGRKRTLTG
jgi:hypothetical protein